MTALQSLIYKNDPEPSLQVLDQLLLPKEKKYVPVANVKDAWSVIRSMQIRGAPLIAIVAVLGLAVDLTTNKSTIDEIEALNNDPDKVEQFITDKLDYLITSRPTAVNLANAVQEVKDVLKKTKTFNKSNSSDKLAKTMIHAVKDHAQFMLERDLQDNRSIGQHGADAILASHPLITEKVTVMTICNTGSLATSGYGTALGIVRALQERQRLHQVVALETRPYNQGSRLTAFEMVQEQMPNATLICDNMVSAFLQHHQVDAIVVGADRVCANGDTANKIGTRNLAMVASLYKVPVYVAAPFTTLDVDLPDGSKIVIEERPANELLESSNAPDNVGVWNPAFDVTPAQYITGIVTEQGVITADADGNLDVAGFVGRKSERTHVKSKLQRPLGYTEQSVDSLPAFLSKHAQKAMEILGTTKASDLECLEVGDGNLNLVFIVTNASDKSKQVIVKQALPYVRCVGESWPLTLERSFFEYKALQAEKAASPDYVPEVYYFSKPNGLMVMEYLKPPCIILRKGLIQGIKYPTMARDMGLYCAHSLFKTSGFALSPTALREQVQFWSRNVELCALTEQVIFTEPYITASNNRWTSPQLDEEKKAIESDVELHVAAQSYKQKFITQTQALIHGDLHSGSVMCSPDEKQTFVIDPEFAFYGPMGFDTGAFVANLFLNYFSQAGHSNEKDYAGWVLEQISTFWSTFVDEFINLWNDKAEHTGYLYGRDVLAMSCKSAHEQFFKELLSDTLGFAGMKMLRRIVGIAHVEDLDGIENVDTRAMCERRAIALAKALIKSSDTFKSMDDVVSMARKFNES